MKVVYFYMSSGQEGSRIHIDSFMQAFAALGETVIDGGVRIAPFLEDKSTWTITRKVQARLQWLWWNISALLRFVWLTLRHRPDVLIVRFMQDHRLFLPLLILPAFLPVVLEVNTLRSNENPQHATPLIRFLDRLTLRRAGRIFVVSRLLRDQIVRSLGMAPEKVAVVENGVDVERFTDALSTDQAKQQLGLQAKFVVGFIGSFKPWHGLQNLLHLAKAIAGNPDNVMFLIVGDGEERKGFEAFVEAEGLSGLVRFSGHVPHAHVPAYLAAMDVTMAPYSTDTFAAGGGFHGSPLKIFEYMAAAKAIIAAPVGQLTELIVDGESGCLIPSEDIAALKAAVYRLRTEASYRHALGTNARKRVEEHYTWRANAEKIRQLCQAVMTVGAPPGR